MIWELERLDRLNATHALIEKVASMKRQRRNAADEFPISIAPACIHVAVADEVVEAGGANPSGKVFEHDVSDTQAFGVPVDDPHGEESNKPLGTVPRGEIC